MKKTSFLLFVLIFSFFSFGQEKQLVHFQGKNYPIETNASKFKNHLKTTEHDYTYVWLHFDKIPTKEALDQLKSNGIHLLSYVSGKTYVAEILKSKVQQLPQEVLGFQPITPEISTEARLWNSDINPEAYVGKNVRILSYSYDSYASSTIMSDLSSKGFEVLQPNKEVGYFEIDCSLDRINELVSQPYFRWSEAWTGVSIKDDTEGRTLHRSNSLDTEFSNGRNYTGDGIGVLVRDDGIVGPHIDFQGRLDNSFANGTNQTHGDGVAGIMAGAGNLDPQKRGMAAGADVFVVNYAASFQDPATLTLINNGSVLITNSSYSDGCNAGYTGGTTTVDQQMIDLPNLLHVFSAGNSNNTNCNYGAGSQWGNITGGHKQGKNVIATANVYFDGSLATSSSRGPAYDGRIKPDITANGQDQLSTAEDNTYQTFGGTSGAAPGIAGISAQLYQAYKEYNNGALPDNALIKATLLNTANDAGNPGPDFKFGWGIVNSFRAVKLIEEDRYLVGSLTNGQTAIHNITVPSNTKEVRFMVYWNDPAATAGASTALVNDLDMTVLSPSSTLHSPWILDPTPNATNLDANATTGADHLNNMEQVLLSNPASGVYTLTLNGFNIPMGTQNYYVVYEIITEGIEMIYPNLGESFAPGTNETIHWDGNGLNSNVLIEFSPDNGSNWSTLANVPASQKLYNWTVPATITGLAKIRVTSGSFTDLSDSSFSIATIVQNQDVSVLCPESVTFTWDAVPNAEFYDLYMLGNKYMEIAGTSSSPSITLPIINPNLSFWYAVRARNTTQNWTSERSIASYYAGGIKNCSLNKDLSILSIQSTDANFSTLCGGDNLVKIKVMNTGTVDQAGFNLSYQVDNLSPVIQTYSANLPAGQQMDFTFATPVSNSLADGSHDLLCRVSLTGDENPSNDSSILVFVKQNVGIATPFINNLNGTLPTAGWSVDNPDDETTWAPENALNMNGQSSQAYFLDHFSYSNATGELDAITTPIFLLGNDSPKFSFELAKAQYPGFTDGLRVEIAQGCSGVYTSIYNKTGAALATAPETQSQFTPLAGNQWRLETIDLAAYAGQLVKFKIVAINGYGNSTYIDNINLTGTSSNIGLAEFERSVFTLYPNPASTKVHLVFNQPSTPDARLIILDQAGRALQTITSNQIQSKTTIDISGLSSGVYFVRCENEDGISVQKFVKEK